MTEADEAASKAKLSPEAKEAASQDKVMTEANRAAIQAKLMPEASRAPSHVHPIWPLDPGKDVVALPPDSG